MEEKNKNPITVKKYANRRLYNTATSSYVTLDNLCQMVKDGTDFIVYDAKSGDDITRSVLTQIIVEEESKGQNLLPIGFLRHLISFYGDSLGGLVPQYLETSMQAFARNEEQMRAMVHSALEGIFPMHNFEEMSRQNAALFDHAVKMFIPFYGEQAAKTVHKDNATAADAIRDLKDKLNDMQSQLDSLTSKTR